MPPVPNDLPVRQTVIGSRSEPSIFLDAISRGHRPLSLVSVNDAPRVPRKPRCNVLKAETARAVFEGSETHERRDQRRRKERCTVLCMPDTNLARPLPPPLAVAHLTDTHLARSFAVAHLTDAELLAGARRLVGRQNQLLADLLAHLGEVESRGLHRTRACSSLYVYCIYDLRFSEDEAYRRVAATRLVKRFPVLLDAVASGELHLTGLLLLGPHLTESNLTEVLARAKHRTKRELAKLVRILDPLPAVPARIEPLGPAPARGLPRAATWEDYAGSFCPVRDLEPGERPRDWMENANDANDADDARLRASEPPDARAHLDATHEALAPERYKVQFTATEEYVRLVEEAKALLSHAAPGLALEELHLRAMRALVSDLKKRKYATKPEAVVNEKPSNANGRREHPSKVMPAHPRQRGRHLPAAIRRAVFQRDGGRCTYVDPSGRRCDEAHRLEFHHIKPFAAGGEHEVSNLTLRCASHNALAADEDLGRERMQEKRFAEVHESFREAERALDGS